MRKINKKEIEKSEKEKLIFEKFSKLFPYSINSDSIRSCIEENEPDIFCELTDGTKIAFELVECIDEKLAKLFNSRAILENNFYKKIKKLPKEKKENFEENFKNAFIYVNFSNNIFNGNIKTNTIISEIIEYLLTLKKIKEGEISIPQLKNILNLLTINLGIVKEITFDVEFVDSFGDNPKERIKNKLNDKKYITRADKIELLAYYELQKEFPGQPWEIDVRECVEKNLNTSIFQRVWIYSFAQNKIILVYPNP